MSTRVGLSTPKETHHSISVAQTPILRPATHQERATRPQHGTIREFAMNGPNATSAGLAVVCPVLVTPRMLAGLMPPRLLLSLPQLRWLLASELPL